MATIRRIDGTFIKSSGCAINSTIIRTDNNTAYDALDVIGNATTSILTFDLATKIPSASQICIFNAFMRVITSSLPAGMTSFRIHLYNALPINIADGTVWALPAADAAKYLGYLPYDITPVDVGEVLYGQVESLNFVRTLVTDKLYGFIQTITGYTPTNLCSKTISLQIATM